MKSSLLGLAALAMHGALEAPYPAFREIHTLPKPKSGKRKKNKNRRKKKC